MKALVFEGVGLISIKDVAEPVIQDPKDVIVKIDVTTICGTDLHALRGSMPDMKPGTVLGHEGVGTIEEIGSHVHTFKRGDRVIIPSTIACGHCHNCMRKLYAQCDTANPHGPDAGTAFYGGPRSSGPFQGLQAEKARVPFADASLIKIPDTIAFEQVILLSDILPTAYQAVEYTEPHVNDSTAVFGCGPVGQLVIACLKKAGVKEIYAIDNVQSRLDLASRQGAHAINFDKEDTVSALRKATKGVGPTKIIDAVGIDANKPQCCGWPSVKSFFQGYDFEQEIKEVAPVTHPNGDLWKPGNAPSQVFQWAVQAIAKGGIFSVIGVYTPLMRYFPIGAVMQKNMTVRAGNCNHRRYIPDLLKWVEAKEFDSSIYLTQRRKFSEIVNAYEHFDRHEDGWVKVLITF